MDNHTNGSQSQSGNGNKQQNPQSNTSQENNQAGGDQSSNLKSNNHSKIPERQTSNQQGSSFQPISQSFGDDNFTSPPPSDPFGKAPTPPGQMQANPFGDKKAPSDPSMQQGGDSTQTGGTGSSDPNYMFGQMHGKTHHDFQTNVKIPSHGLTFDEQYFLWLLAGSISLTIDEKRKIVESIPRLKQEQIEELIRILEEERSKFQELSPKHGDQLKKLELRHDQEWMDFEISVKAGNKASEDQAKADEIRKKLGL